MTVFGPKSAILPRGPPHQIKGSWSSIREFYHVGQFTPQRAARAVLQALGELQPLTRIFFFSLFITLLFSLCQLDPGDHK